MAAAQTDSSRQQQAQQVQQLQFTPQLLLAAKQCFAELIEVGDYPDEVLEMWRQRDAAADAPVAKQEQPMAQQNGAWRRAASRFFLYCGERLGDARQGWFQELNFEQRKAVLHMSFRAMRMEDEQQTARSMWFQAMALLDAVCERTPASKAADFLPRACVAIASLVYKAELQAETPSPAAVWGMVGSLSQAFKAEGGLAAPEITAEEVEEQRMPPAESMLAAVEQEVLRLLQWRVQVTTVETWVQAFAWRFDAATKQCFRPSVLQALEIGIDLACRSEGIISSRVNDPEALARGLLCHGLLAVGALSWQSDHPAGFACAVALEVATGASCAELMEDSTRCEALLRLVASRKVSC